MRKQLTGEPVAGELHTGFGGRGRQKPFPTPIPRPSGVIRLPEVPAGYSGQYYQKTRFLNHVVYSDPIDQAL